MAGGSMLKWSMSLAVPNMLRMLVLPLALSLVLSSEVVLTLVRKSMSFFALAFCLEVLVTFDFLRGAAAAAAAA
eukprot:CAMPEP_0182515656 /NCGR_PEP_ID=MMETSP1321-20130603/38596_1 /TAXON_ID=91990 /ORGANISM="Bolidomonas sp., Strain RCC1657" /LENGTH=73 /DNA_ID=CAMNT_0024723115 /DNA_START=131 /DNA_END=348 /DNA_ORIENTATION=-